MPAKKTQKKPAKAKNAKPAKQPAKTIPQRDGPPDQIEVYFDVRDSSYWYRLNGSYVQLSKSDLALHLKVLGLRDDVYFQGLDEHDWVCWNAQCTRQVHYAGPLAGHRVGIFTNGSGKRFLVTTEAAGVWDDIPKKPQPPKWLLSFIQELLPDPQWTFFVYWLAEALRSLRRGDFRPGQVVALVGPARCGKSLLQQIVTEVLGGRSCNPLRYLTGQTQFNRDLAESEHWMMEDPKSTTGNTARREFGDMLKNALVRNLSIHAKNKDATLTLPALIRITISVNNEQENVARIPPVDPSLADKLFLLNCERVTEAFEQFRIVNGTPSLLNETKQDGELDQAALWKKVQDEIPAFRAWLVGGMPPIPPALRDDRYGIKYYHDPKLLADLSALDPWDRMLQLASEVLFKYTDNNGRPCEPDPWIGKAIELEKELLESKFAFAANKIFTHQGACGSHLARLASSHPDRVSKRVKDGYSIWTILPPSPKETNEETESD